MHVHFLDPYLPRPSAIHRLDPRVKLVLTLVFILIVALTPPGAWAVYILLFAIILSVELLSELGVGFVLRRALFALPFVMAALPIIFTYPGPDFASFPLGPWTVTISQGGLERFISIALKSWISVQAAIILASSTTFPDLLVAMRAIRLPRLLVAIFSLMWRYLFVLADEVLRMNRARAARSGHPDDPKRKVGGTVAWRAQVTGRMAGSLFLRALERSDRIYMAMVSRGYDGEIRSLPLPALRPLDWLITITGILFLILVFSISYLV